MGYEEEEELNVEEEEEVDYDIEEEEPATGEEAAATRQDTQTARSESAEKRAKAPISWKAWKGPGEPDTPRDNGHGRSRKRSSDHSSRERQSKERKGRDQGRSRERSSMERPARVMPVASRRTAPADSPPRRHVIELRSPSRDRVAHGHQGNGMVMRRSMSPPGLRRRSRSPPGMRRRPRSPLPVRQLERFPTPRMVRREAPSFLAPRFVDTHERSPPRRILVEIDPRDLPPGGLEYRGERLMPRLTRLPDVLDYPIRTHHAPRIIYDDGPRRDMDERMPPSRYPMFDERESMSRGRDVGLERQPSDIDRMWQDSLEARGHPGSRMDRQGWEARLEHRAGLPLRERSPPVRKALSPPLSRPVVELQRIHSPDVPILRRNSSGVLERRDGRRRATAFSSANADEPPRSRGGELAGPSGRPPAKKADDKEGKRKDGKHTAIDARKETAAGDSRPKAEKSNSASDRKAAKEDKARSSSGKIHATPARPEVPVVVAKVKGKSSQAPTAAKAAKPIKGKEQSAAKPAAKTSAGKEEPSTSKPPAKSTSDRTKPAQPSTQANSKQLAPSPKSRGPAVSKPAQAAAKESKAANRKQEKVDKGSSSTKHVKSAPEKEFTVPHNSERAKAQPAIEKPARRAEPIVSSGPAKRPRTQATLPLPPVAMPRELPMPPMGDTRMRHEPALLIPPDNLLLPPPLVEEPFVPGIASALPLPPPPPLPSAPRVVISSYGPPSGRVHPDSGWSEDLPMNGYGRRVQDVGIRYVQEVSRRRPFGQQSPGRSQAPRQIREVRNSRFADVPERRSPPGLAASHPDMRAEWFYLDPQGVTQGPNSKWQLRTWLTQLANANDPDRHQAFCEVAVWRRDWPASNAVPLLHLLNG